MPAVVASRYNLDLKAKVNTIRKLGKSTKIAITTIMRKLVVLANALLSKGKLWTLKPA
jgi:transposase